MKCLIRVARTFTFETIYVFVDAFATCGTSLSGLENMGPTAQSECQSIRHDRVWEGKHLAFNETISPTK